MVNLQKNYNFFLVFENELHAFFIILILIPSQIVH